MQPAIQPAKKKTGTASAGTARVLVQESVLNIPAETAKKGRKTSQPVPAAGPESALDPDNMQEGKAGKAFWIGTISIGLVNVPVRLHTMVRDRSFSFRLLHREDGQPLRYDRVCSKEGRVIPWNETVTGYEVRKREFVVFEPDELKAVMPESTKKIKIEKFVHFLSLDPIYFELPYMLIPNRSQEAYWLLATALEELGLVAVGTVITLRTKEAPAVVHVFKGALVLTTLRYANEVTPPHSFDGVSDLPAPKEAELTMVKWIITDLYGDFSIRDYHDHYADSVKALIEKKLAGEKIVYEAPRPEEAKELMQALKETLVSLLKK